MSKKVKVLVSVLVVAVLLTAGGVTTVMAQEGSEPPPEASTEETSTKGLLARVAEILGVSQEELVNAFKQAQQEIREEALDKLLAKAVEEGLITEDEANEIKGWWEEARPEVLDQGLCRRARAFTAMRGCQAAVLGKAMGRVCITQEQPERIRERWENRQEALNRTALRARIFKAIRSRQ